MDLEVRAVKEYSTLPKTGASPLDAIYVHMQDTVFREGSYTPTGNMVYSKSHKKRFLDKKILRLMV